MYKEWGSWRRSPNMQIIFAYGLLKCSRVQGEAWSLVTLKEREFEEEPRRKVTSTACNLFISVQGCWSSIRDKAKCDLAGGLSHRRDRLTRPGMAIDTGFQVNTKI